MDDWNKPRGIARRLPLLFSLGWGMLLKIGFGYDAVACVPGHCQVVSNFVIACHTFVTNMPRVVDTRPVCVGSTMEFKHPVLTEDLGGHLIRRYLVKKNRNCPDHVIDCQEDVPAQPVLYTWIIWKGSNKVATGSGDTASCTPVEPGTYTCRFITRVTRATCPPVPSVWTTSVSRVAYEVQVTGAVTRLCVGQTAGFSALNTIGPVTWASSAPAVASVAGGLVTGLAPGHAVISATDSNGCSASIPITVLSVDFIEASSPVADNSPQQFEGHKTDFGDPCSDTDPGQALIIFYEDVSDGNHQVQDFDIDLTANILPSSITHDQLSEVWTKTAGPSSGSFDRTDTFAVKYQNPAKGGIYQFEFDLGLNFEPSGAKALLPLAGATIDTWLEGEVSAMGGRASSWQNDVYLNSPIAGIEIYKHKVFAMISAYDFDYVGQSRNAQGTCPCENYSHGDTQFDDPAYVTISGVVVHRSKINNLLWAVFGRHLGYPESWLRTGAFYNQAFQQNQNINLFDNIHLFIDPPSSQKAIELGSKRYKNNSVATEVPAAKARELQVGGTLFDKKLWPCTDALDSGNSTLKGPYDILPTEYIE